MKSAMELICKEEITPKSWSITAKTWITIAKKYQVLETKTWTTIRNKSWPIKLLPTIYQVLGDQDLDNN